MTDEEVFASAIHVLDEPGRPPTAVYKPGPRWTWTEGLVHEATAQADRHRPLATSPMPRVIHGLVLDPRLNAAAFAHPDPARTEFIVSLNGGTAMLLYNLFCRLLCEPSVFPTIGDASRETSLPHGPLHTDAEAMSRAYRSSTLKPQDLMPSDPDRRSLAMILLFIALDFLLNHEYRHVQAGHLNYLRRQPGGTPLIREAYGTAPSATSAMQFQALEVDADCMAAAWAFDRARTLIKDGGEHDPEGKWKRFMPDPTRAAYFIDFAVHCLWRLFGDSVPPILDWKLLNHPPARLRQRMIAFALQQNLGEFIGAEAAGRFEKQHREMLLEAESGFAVVTGRSSETDGLIVSLSNESIDHLREINLVWQSIEDAVEREAYCSFEPLREFRNRQGSAENPPR